MVLPPHSSPYSATRRPWLDFLSIGFPFHLRGRSPHPSSKALAPHLSQMLTGPFKWLAVQPSPTPQGFSMQVQGTWGTRVMGCRVQNLGRSRNTPSNQLSCSQ